MLAGVRFDGESGLAGHSDADVVCHALAEAMLGAAALGDLGTHLPDDDPATEGIAGLELLARIGSIVGNAGLRLDSCDLTVIADRPAIAPRREEMRRNLARTLGAEADRVSVKATRPEGLGLSGDGAGCIAIAVLAPARL
jgi:2-C-methyl-D-erythritol 2,4-cyclodiphosphate synthase